MTPPDPAPFDFAVLDAAYVSPSYLRTPLREFLLTNDRGVYWLRAPAGMGKTMFVRGIIARRPGRDPSTTEGIDSAISSDIRAVGVHLQGSVSPAALVDALRTELAGAPADGAADVTPKGLIDLFRAAHAQAVAGGAKRLLVCIDGLEQLDTSSAEILPAAAEIPAGIVLLLVSRPAADWPQDRFEKAAAQVGSGAVVREIAYDDGVYTDMLRGYFKDKTRPLMRSRAVAHLSQLLESRATFERGGRDNRLTNDPTLRDALKDDWKKLTNKHPRYTGLPLPVTPLVAMLDQFDQLWVDLIDRAERRFDGVSSIIRGLTDGSLQLEEVAGLPGGADLRARLGTLTTPPAS